MKRIGLRAGIAGAIVISAVRLLAAAESVDISVPAFLTFSVPNVGQNSGASGGNTTITFSNGTFDPGRVLQISVTANDDFAGPGGYAMPAALVSWNLQGATNGVGANGTIGTSGVYVPMFVSEISKVSGSVTVTWSLAAPGTPLRAGDYFLTLHWKLETITALPGPIADARPRPGSVGPWARWSLTKPLRERP